ncbi:anthranilate synthase beta subunit 1, chloroplastic, partial [Arabidopsis lyrata subsp. lyrata]|uniref:anthranilate synthase beta subunit 1, chloroplastic n=1 Tax=Arabidopsis lyrata subsp. lyrata TaxID=81972 RepID=UPI000A29B9D2
MAATTQYKSCLLQPKSGSTTRRLNPSLVNPLTNPTRVSVLGKSRRDVFAKASMEMAESNSIPSVVVNSSKQNGPIIVIDNYDSFTYNLCQYMGELGCHFEVYRNDELTVEELKRKNPRGVLISPGPGKYFGVCGVAILGLLSFST